MSSKLWTLAPLRHLRALQPQLPRASGTAVVAGDFNFWGPRCGGDAAGVAARGAGPDVSRAPAAHQIDHMLVRDDIEVLSGEVLPATPSDHRPIRARLRL